MRITSLPQYARNANRFREILTILAKYGLADWLHESDPDFINNLLKSAAGDRLTRLTRAERVRLALTELGTTFIKLGQILSTRPDLVGTDLADELAHLQADTPADPPETVRALIEEDLGHPVEVLFAEFDDNAMASASIGQVHAARLHDGKSVVVKVQHKGIEEVIEKDLDILVTLVELAERHSSEARLYQPKAAAEEFRRTILRELDFLREQRNLEQFTRNFEGNKTIHIPQPFPDLSARRVLTMERLDGCSISETGKIEAAGLDSGELVRHGATLYLDMIFHHGFFHADPHPGNILVLEGGVIGLLDCGMVGRIDDLTREEFETVLISATSGDADELTECVLRLGTPPVDLDRDALRIDVADFLGEYLAVSLKDLDLSGALTGVINLIRKYHVVLPSNVGLLVRVLIMLEGTSRNLSRDFSLAELIQPYRTTMIRRRLSPARIKQRLLRTYRDWDRLLDMLPREGVQIIDRMRRGQFDVNLKHRHLDATVNRLVYGIIVAALFFLGSAMIWSSAVPPLLFGVSVFGVLGCLTAITLGFRLLWAIHKAGGLGKDDEAY